MSNTLDCNFHPVLFSRFIDQLCLLGWTATILHMRQHEGIEQAKKEEKFKGRIKKYHKNHAGMNYAVMIYKEGDMTVNNKCV